MPDQGKRVSAIMPRVFEAGQQVVIDHTYRLHERMADRWAHELESPAAQAV
jgi:hypothetical protein